MIKHSSPFALFQQVVHWLDTSIRAPRQGRRYLEANSLLLQANAERELARLVRAHKGDIADTYQQLRTHLYLLRDTCRKGNTIQAIRSSYVNIYGGLCLDLPPSLEDIEQQYTLLLKLRRPERTCRAQLHLLRLALTQASTPEIRAELLNELGNLLIQSPHYDTQQRRLQAIEEAIYLHETASSIFTLNDYPQQHARTMILLGNACYSYALAGYQVALSRALTCYDEALLIYTHSYAPTQWAQLQSNKGRVYALQEPGSNQAVESHIAALSTLQRTTSPLSWASIQANLGDAYRLHAASCPHQRSEYLGRAMACYRAALQVYTLANAAREWAELHVRMGTLYYNYTRAIPTNGEQYDTYVRCAIVCCESALQAYTLESFPLEYATTQACLGHLHYSLRRGDTRTNLEQARTCYQLASHIFTRPAFPQDALRVQLALSEITARIASCQQS